MSIRLQKPQEAKQPYPSIAGQISFTPTYRPAKACRLHSMAEDTHRVVVVCALVGFLCSSPYARYGALRTERRTKDLFMATQPNRDSTLPGGKVELATRAAGA